MFAGPFGRGNHTHLRPAILEVIQMVKQTNKAQETKTSGATVDKTTEGYLQAFGKETYLKACKIADEAIGTVRDADTVIAQKRGGNAKVIHELAKHCVILTMKGQRAFLDKASELFRAACAHAEENLVARVAKENGGIEQPIAEVVPSWPPMRTNVIHGMGKAGIDPRKVDNYTAIENGYKEWKAKPENAADKSTRGRKASATDKSGTDKAREAAPIVEHAVAKSLSTDVKKAIAELCIALALCNKDQQDEATGLLRAMAAGYTQKGQEYQKEHAVEVAAAPTTERRRPAREAGPTGATAE